MPNQKAPQDERPSGKVPPSDPGSVSSGLQRCMNTRALIPPYPWEASSPAFSTAITLPRCMPDSFSSPMIMISPPRLEMTHTMTVFLQGLSGLIAALLLAFNIKGLKKSLFGDCTRNHHV